MQNYLYVAASSLVLMATSSVLAQSNDTAGALIAGDNLAAASQLSSASFDPALAFHPTDISDADTYGPSAIGLSAVPYFKSSMRSGAFPQDLPGSRTNRIQKMKQDYKTPQKEYK